MKMIFKKNNPTSAQPGEKAESFFLRLIKRLDRKDRDLAPEKRKRKWLHILMALFAFYLLSFLFPVTKPVHQPLNAPSPSGVNDSLSAGNTSRNQKPLTFEMPVDSFENILKENMDRVSHRAGHLPQKADTTFKH